MQSIPRESRPMQNFVGEKIGDLVVEACLSNGPFAQVYRARNAVTGEISALKIAQPDSLEPAIRPPHDQSQALEEITGAVMQVHPNPRALLHYQMKFTQNAGPTIFPEFLSIIEETDRQLVGFSMEFIDGFTLKDLIASNAATVDHGIDVAAALSRLLSSAQYHGDLKPSNVIFDGTNARLLDPGFFGEMESSFGDRSPMKITTPLYYPFLKPDDFLALGFIAWEITFGRHPLQYGECEDALLSSKLDLIIRRQENSGQFFLSPIRKLPLPCYLIPQIEPEAQKILLKLLRISLTDGDELDLDPGYQSISEIVEALTRLEYLLQGKPN